MTVVGEVVPLVRTCVHVCVVCMLDQPLLCSWAGDSTPPTRCRSFPHCPPVVPNVPSCMYTERLG